MKLSELIPHIYFSHEVISIDSHTIISRMKLSQLTPMQLNVASRYLNSLLNNYISHEIISINSDRVISRMSLSQLIPHISFSHEVISIVSDTLLSRMKLS